MYKHLHLCMKLSHVTRSNYIYEVCDMTPFFLSPSLSLSICLSVSLSLPMFLTLSPSLSVYPSPTYIKCVTSLLFPYTLEVYACVSVFTKVLNDYLFIYVFIDSFIHLFIYLGVYNLVGRRRARACRAPSHAAGVCCSVLQGVAGCCRVLQGVAGCCRVL